MPKFAMTILAALTLVQPALSVADVAPHGIRPRPSSFVPHAHANLHVYGTPIEPAIVGHANHAHPKHGPSKPSLGI